MSQTPVEPGSNPDPMSWDALGRYLTGEATPEESARIRAWLAEDVRHAVVLKRLEQSITRVAAAESADIDVENALARITERIGQPAGAPPKERAARGWRTIPLAAAALLAVAVGGTALWRSLQSDTPTTSAVAAVSHETSIGQTDTITLADGSTVVLAPVSRLTVSAAYGAGARAVRLEGQAMFTVTHDASKPFRVWAGAALVEDLGTVFSVHTLPANEVRVVVTEGVVRVRAAANPGEGVVLNPGDRALLARDQRLIAERGGLTDADVAWTRGQLVFADTPLAELPDVLRRWYGIELRIDGTLNGRLNATFKTESKDEVVKIIALALGARVEQRGDTIVLRGQGGR